MAQRLSGLPSSFLCPLPRAIISRMLPKLAAMAEALLDDLFDRFPVADRPVIVWKNLRVSAGMAYYKHNSIGLSKIILIDDVRLRDTLIHEYAHLLAVHRQGRKAAAHGLAWKTAMIDLGAEPRVRHSYPVKRNARCIEIRYSCLKCGITLVRSRRLPRKRTYVHAGCGGALRFAGAFRVTPGKPTS